MKLVSTSYTHTYPISYPHAVVPCPSIPCINIPSASNSVSKDIVIGVPGIQTALRAIESAGGKGSVKRGKDAGFGGGEAGVLGGGGGGWGARDLLGGGGSREC